MGHQPYSNASQVAAAEDGRAPGTSGPADAVEALLVAAGLRIVELELAGSDLGNGSEDGPVAQGDRDVR